ncbi:carbamoyltransferase N-terminal domain-containing protein [uncultured Kriegella sp.]|uniref:carbamoyltransferase family protein n=1 Tax=uncultured Kriegella sp. TaxID=1798910 RepID=UPI0030D72F63|tara:strand:+ start:54814 stop:56643 length:1830 start_codon:yes stop_codon:yes gene_type:complete
MEIILGISAFYHDSAAALVANGTILGAAQEERFSRIKHDSSFPTSAISHLLSSSEIEPEEVTAVVFYEKPFLKFERLIETYHAFAPKGFRSFLRAVPLWIKEKLHTKRNIKRKLEELGICAEILFSEHHLSHAASAFYPSPFLKAAILTIDGVGEWCTTAIAKGEEQNITTLCELHFPHSLGLLYSAFTYYCGFKVNSGEYKLMGLAPYGLDCEETQQMVDKIRSTLINIADDGSFTLNMGYFNFATGLTMTNDVLWESLFKIPRRSPESELRQEFMNLARAVQLVTEEIVLKLAKTARHLTQCNNLVMAGGVALNCVANGKIAASGLFENIWIQPASGDAGGALGAALAVWYLKYRGKRTINLDDGMNGSLIGGVSKQQQVVSFGKNAIKQTLDDDRLFSTVAEKLSQGAIVGWFQGEMEFGPRALGNRSILADPRHSETQHMINNKIKYRENFRPFAPAVLKERVDQYFEMPIYNSYMLMTAPVKAQHRLLFPDNFHSMDWKKRLYLNRSTIQAVTHIDYSARVQVVNKKKTPRFHSLIEAFCKITGCAMLLNTSFNVRGEPIVFSPSDAYRCFMSTGMDYLVVGNDLYAKSDQPFENLIAPLKKND